jgi:geranylgeranyl diphosphate synthase type II
MNFDEKIKYYSQLTDAKIDSLLPKEDKFPSTIYKAMRYSIFAGGKRLRPMLVLAACEALGGSIEAALPFACAIEIIHTYSLIHDDLPAMDNDDYRRGRLTSHKVFGDAMAILAGDGLLNKAAEVMLGTALSNKSETKYVEAAYEIMTASGTEGMIGGQVVDLESENKLIDFDTLKFMHKNKTGAMIRAAVRSGAIIGGASKEELDMLTHFSENLGLAFQIKDDILDIIGDKDKLGKSVGKDINSNKSTFPAVYGLEKSKMMVEEFSSKAIECLNNFGEDAGFLKDIAEYLVNRES